MTMKRLINEMHEAMDFPGIVTSWTQPIQGRIDLLATGIRTPVGVKVFGPDLAELERIGREVEHAVQMVPGTRSAFAERAVSGYYLDIDIDRQAAARYGLNIADIQTVIGAAIGGMTITQTVEGRERYAVRLRYPQELRDQPEKLAEVLIPVANAGSAPTASGSGGMAGMSGGSRSGPGVAQIPLGQVATIRLVSVAMAIETEGGLPAAGGSGDVEGRDLGS